MCFSDVEVKANVEVNVFKVHMVKLCEGINLYFICSDIDLHAWLWPPDIHVNVGILLDHHSCQLTCKCKINRTEQITFLRCHFIHFIEYCSAQSIVHIQLSTQQCRIRFSTF